MTHRPDCDPFARAFLEDESLPLIEKLGRGVKECAKYQRITFDYFLPNVPAQPSGCGSWFGMTYGVVQWYSCPALLKEFPDEQDYLRENEERMKSYVGTDYVSQTLQGKALSDAKAEWGGGWGGHSNPNYGLPVRIGTDGIREKIKKYREINKKESSVSFYNSCMDFLDAIDILGARFKSHAEAEAMKAEKEGREEDMKKYDRIAEAFRVIPQRGAYDFTSAVLYFWFIYSFHNPDSPGRLDEIFAPFITDDNDAERYEMLNRLWEAFHGTRTWNVCISGSDENRKDETNAVSYDILKIAQEKKYQTPNLTMRVHRNTPDTLWKEAAKTLATGIGMPAIYNDECVCPALEKLGIPPCDSHDYCMNGCNQIDIFGKSHMGLEDGEVCFAKALELTLHRGIDTLSGEKVGIDTGNPENWKDFSALRTAFYRQLDFLSAVSCENSNVSQLSNAIYAPSPLRSMMIEGCIEKGIDYRNGGPLYNHGQILGEGIADAADSLYAIKKLVFDEKKYTMSELLTALRDNFVGHEKLHRDFSDCEKFGNDNEEADGICADAVAHFFAFLKEIHTYRGGVFTGGCSPYDRAADYGIHVGALPNGKKKGESLIADSIGATPGKDICGPTAVLKSCLKYPHSEAGSGFILNIKFDKKLFATPKGMTAFISLAKAYFCGGGQQITVTVVSREELLDAKIHPELHRDLIVRVGGYSDYFVNLTPELQENVIARTDNML